MTGKWLLALGLPMLLVSGFAAAWFALRPPSGSLVDAAQPQHISARWKPDTRTVVFTKWGGIQIAEVNEDAWYSLPVGDGGTLVVYVGRNGRVSWNSVVP